MSIFGIKFKSKSRKDRREALKNIRRKRTKPILKQRAHEEKLERRAELYKAQAELYEAKARRKRAKKAASRQGFPWGGAVKKKKHSQRLGGFRLY